MPDLASRLRAFGGSWLRQGTWTVMDQALFAGANFLVNVLLARWLTPEAYGAFTVAFVVFLLAGTVHGGLLIEPMLVFGPGKFEGKTGPYLRVLLRAHAGFSAVAGALLAVVGGVAWALGSPELAAVFLALAISQPAILALWLLRRACFVVSKPSWAAGAGALYMALLAGGAVALYRVDALTGPLALVLMAVASLAACAVLAGRLGVFRREQVPGLAADARAAHIEYGRWSASTGVLEWVQLAVPFLALPLFVGLEGSGTLRALFNLAMPALQGFGALATLCLPLFVRARAAGTFDRTFRQIGGAFLGLGALYGVLVLAFGEVAVAWLYDGKYAATPGALAFLALIPFVVAGSNMLTTAVRSAELPSAVFRARTWAVGVTGTVVLALTAAFGVVGALAGEVVVLLTEVAALWGPARRARPSGDAAPPDPARLRVLLSAFACDPTEGSEGGVGWNTARELARHHDVTVLTYAGARQPIEAELAERPVPGLSVAYAALPFEPAKYRVEGRPMGPRWEQLHYLLWQVWAGRTARRLHRERPFDLAHHITFARYWAPSAVAGLGVPFVWGPVGGGEDAPPAFVDALDTAGQHYERRRAQARDFVERLPSVRRLARRGALAFATTEETAARMRALGARHVEVRSAIGLDAADVARLAALPPATGPVRFLCVGRQLAWKGYRFAIEAFALAALPGAELWLVGDGPEHDALTALADELGVADTVRLFGRLDRPEVLDVLAQAHVLVQPSLHDSGGAVCLEALGAGRPVVGFALGGTVVHVPADAGLLVPAEAPGPAVAALAHAMRELAADPVRRARMGAAGRHLVADQFGWADRVADLADRYWDLVDRPRPVAAAEPEMAWT
ncbi:glycosyltransferase [Rubrivirga sp. IMCC45206]|uniref:glycosyltransferase n=1 Tax=Rubrivirga sp. IMCC45206 TaxID=3391614 RepID=UPI00398FAAE3